jgi:peptide/nickel transport system substrate-binding protein
MPRLQLKIILALILLFAAFHTGCFSRKTGATAARFKQPLVLKVNAASAPTRQYAGILQDQLKQVGIPCEIETVEFNTLLDQQRKGQFQLTTGRWVGGNQDPIYLHDLFRTGAYQNRGRYSNPRGSGTLTRWSSRAGMCRT